MYQFKLKDIADRLAPLGLPVYFDMTQIPKTTSDFVLIESSTSTTEKTAQSGPFIETYSQLLSIYTGGGRTKAENLRGQAVRLLGRNWTTSHTIMKDNSMGRELYHISIRFNELIM